MKSLVSLVLFWGVIVLIRVWLEKGQPMGRLKSRLLVICASLAFMTLGACERSQGPTAASLAEELRAAPAAPLLVAMDTTVSGGLFPLVEGTTNLPEGTHLWIELKHPSPACEGCVERDTPANASETMMAGGLVRVAGGRFSAGPQWKTMVPMPVTRDVRQPLSPGRYILEIQVLGLSASDQEPPNVVATFGPGSRNLEGPLVNNCCFGQSPNRAEKDRKESQSYFGFESSVYYARYVQVPQLTAEHAAATERASAYVRDPYAADRAAEKEADASKPPK